MRIFFLFLFTLFLNNMTFSGCNTKKLPQETSDVVLEIPILTYYRTQKSNSKIFSTVKYQLTETGRFYSTAEKKQIKKEPKPLNNASDHLDRVFFLMNYITNSRGQIDTDTSNINNISAEPNRKKISPSEDFYLKSLKGAREEAFPKSTFPKHWFDTFYRTISVLAFNKSSTKNQEDLIICKLSEPDSKTRYEQGEFFVYFNIKKTVFDSNEGKHLSDFDFFCAETLEDLIGQLSTEQKQQFIKYSNIDEKIEARHLTSYKLKTIPPKDNKFTKDHTWEEYEYESEYESESESESESRSSEED